MSRRQFEIAVFDLDGTLLDSDAALVQAFVALGVERSDVTFGHVLADECSRLGIQLADYISAYDVGAARPYPGVDDLLARLSRWAVCSNKHGPSGRAELERLRWSPSVAYFADQFDGPKDLAPVVAVLGVPAARVLFIGDTDHDRACAERSGCGFALAGWNPRARAMAGDLVLEEPAAALGHLAT